MKFKITILAFCISMLSFAQERYRVLYDYETEKVSYLQLDKNNKVKDTLERPKIKRNSLVELRLINVNPFAVDVQTDVKEEELHQGGDGFNFSSLLGGINSFSSSDMGLNVQNLPASDLFTKSSSRGPGISSVFSNLNDMTSNVSALKTTMMSNFLNPNLSKEDILENVLNTATVSLQSSVHIPDPNDNFYVFISQIERLVQENKASLASDITAMSKEVENEADSSVALSRGELIERNYLISDLQSLLTNLNESTFQTVEDLNKIKSLYTMLEASSFERTYDYMLEADKVNIELKFVQSDFASEADSKNDGNTLKTRNIKLYSKGGFKINTGIALTLNNFGSKSQDFYVDEHGVIGSDKNDYFTPNLSTMINFYPYTGESFNIGGSFGLSIPISGDSSAKGINFLLGPSLHFGSKSRLSVSGGLAYGPVQKLTNGLELGDTINLGVENFTKDVYDFGYFFGISFSLFDIN